jgi:hypothetical protein
MAAHRGTLVAIEFGAVSSEEQDSRLLTSLTGRSILAFGSNAMSRPQVIAFRLSPEEHLHLAAAARAGGLTPSAWCRRAVLERLAGGAQPAAPAAVAAPVPATPAPTAAAAATAAAAGEPEPLSRVVGAKLTPSQYFDLEARAKGAGVTVGTYLRHLVQGQPPTARWPLARAAIVQLAKAGNNLNQLVKLAHTGTLLSRDLYGAVQSVLVEVRSVRRALLHEEPRE